MNTPSQKRFDNKRKAPGRYTPLQGRLSLAPRMLRLELGLTQAEFWAPVGVSQSGGSRYESGRKLPAAISALLYLVHIEGLNIDEINGEDHRVGRHLREHSPTTYAALQKDCAPAKR